MNEIKTKIKSLNFLDSTIPVYFALVNVNFWQLARDLRCNQKSYGFACFHRNDIKRLLPDNLLQYAFDVANVCYINGKPYLDSG